MPYGTVSLGDTSNLYADIKYFRISLGQFATSVKLAEIPKSDSGNTQKELDEANQAEQHFKFFEAKIPSNTPFQIESKIDSWSADTGGMIVKKDAVPLMTEFCLGISKIKNFSVFDSLNDLKHSFNTVHQKQQDVNHILDSNSVEELEGKFLQVTVQQRVEKFAYHMWELKLELQGQMYTTKCAKNEGKEAKLGLVEPIGKI
eukprot:GHVT01103076.1.p1 GENE.GHVT01103076.1~~GHVT01103076.1.p1  ORF type:complete len:202 (-),score=13.19 GHVT01103076.1:119-724(-)